MIHNWLRILSSWVLLPHCMLKKQMKKNVFLPFSHHHSLFYAWKQQLHCFTFALQGMCLAFAKKQGRGKIKLEKQLALGRSKFGTSPLHLELSSLPLLCKPLGLLVFPFPEGLSGVGWAQPHTDPCLHISEEPRYLSVIWQKKKTHLYSAH